MSPNSANLEGEGSRNLWNAISKFTEKGIGTPLPPPPPPTANTIIPLRKKKLNPYISNSILPYMFYVIYHINYLIYNFHVFLKYFLHMYYTWIPCHTLHCTCTLKFLFHGKLYVENEWIRILYKHYIRQNKVIKYLITFLLFIND